MTRTQRGPGHVVIVFGSTGTAGRGVVHACLADAGVSQVRAVTRRPLGVSHAKLLEVACSDFADLDRIVPQFEGVDCCLFCLGTSVRNVEGEDQYREIHESYPLAAARTQLERSPDASFVYLSGAGANRASRMIWARVKAEAEDRSSELSRPRRPQRARPGNLDARPCFRRSRANTCCADSVRLAFTFATPRWMPSSVSRSEVSASFG